MTNRLRTLALVLATTSLAASCSPGTEPLNTTSGLTFAADPSAFLLAPLEVESVIVNSTPIGPVLGNVAWSSSDPKVVTVDSVVAIGAPATVRAVAAGTASLRAVISSQGNQTTISVPVRVRIN